VQFNLQAIAEFVDCLDLVLLAGVADESTHLVF
jgi:hypothetical protein